MVPATAPAPAKSARGRSAVSRGGNGPGDEISLSNDIAQQLEEDVLRGRIRPGQRLDERELSERYGVSRTPIREALQRLSANGLAVARGRQGLQVTQFSIADLLDALSVVAELEALASAQAARRITSGQRTALQVAHDACGRAIEAGSFDDFYDANIDFHRAIADASHNGVLQDELRRLSLRTAPYRRAITFQPGRMAVSQPEHGEVMEAILHNDGMRAAELMRRHISLLTDGIADFLHFVHASDNASLFSNEK